MGSPPNKIATRHVSRELDANVAMRSVKPGPLTPLCSRGSKSTVSIAFPLPHWFCDSSEESFKSFRRNQRALERVIHATNAFLSKRVYYSQRNCSKFKFMTKEFSSYFPK
ncbi:hypothetical protein CEXT_390451 [Caerostris extrusa]|uniref:Uncharacterized protein n=1 Tax=Caerostris extrusa TaxID=172846 RepID=A0AAV4QAQ6_CAEEX|nr:hypothetical protein CEXT_390451 [Caerostris extrusa]